MQEIFRDETKYELINTNISKDIISKITKSCKIHNKIFTKKGLPRYYPKTSRLYELPKIYMSVEIKIAVETQISEFPEIPNPSEIKFKPIVAASLLPTKKLSKLTDI